MEGGAEKGHMTGREGQGTVKSPSPRSFLPSPFTEHCQRPKHTRGIRDEIENAQWFLASWCSQPRGAGRHWTESLTGSPAVVAGLGLGVCHRSIQQRGFPSREEVEEASWRPNLKALWELGR